MLLYFLNCIFIYFISIFNRGRLLFLVILVSISVLLCLLPSTKADYDEYKLDYDSAYFDNVFPYFHTNSLLTSEPFYKFYQSLVKVCTGFPFNFFLSFNFLFCSLLLFGALKKIFKEKYIVMYFLIFIMTVAPTVFYFSPRSSISFVMALYAFVYFSMGNKMKAFIFSFITISIHSQFILILIVMVLNTYYYDIWFKKSRNKKGSMLRYSLILFFYNFFTYKVSYDSLLSV